MENIKNNSTQNSTTAIELVVSNNQVVVSSRQIAEHFEKQHCHVLATIENLIIENSIAKFFHQMTYGKRGKQYKEYLMNRDGFTLLVMSFTGKKALDWKIRYIEAFNAMEAKLRSQSTKPYAALPDFTNPVIAARAWADEVEAKEHALSALREAEPKADYYDKCMDSTNLYTTTEVAQEIGWNAAELYNFLHEHGVIYRVGYRATSKKKPYLYPWVLSPRYLWLQDEGIADIITYWLPNGKTTKTIKWTCKGAEWVQDFVDKHN